MFTLQYTTPAWPYTGSGSDIYAVPQLFLFPLWTIVPYLLLPDAGSAGVYHPNQYRWVRLDQPLKSAGTVMLPAEIGHTCRVDSSQSLSCYNEVSQQQQYIVMQFTETFLPFNVEYNYTNQPFDIEWQPAGQAIGNGELSFVVYCA